MRPATEHYGELKVALGLAISNYRCGFRLGALRFRPKTAGLRVATAVVALFLCGTASLGQTVCTRLDKGRERSHIIHGQFARGKPNTTFCFYALSGRHVLVRIRPSGGLNTEANIKFAGTPAQPDWAPGSPGGIVFDEKVPWSGKYLIVVGQRFDEKKVGKFEIDISTD
jgi:hypothetical protein